MPTPTNEKPAIDDRDYFDSEYVGCVIKNIHRGKESEGRGHIIYATLYSASGELLIGADLDYIVRAISQRIPKVP